MMIPVLELNTADAVIANARRVRSVFYPPRQVPPTQVIAAPIVVAVEEIAAPVTPDRPSRSPYQHPPLERLLDSFVLHFSNADELRVSMDAILNRVATVFRVGVANLKSERRTTELMLPRHAFCYLAKEMTGKSYPSIGRFLGGRDHTTILHGAKRCASIMAIDPDYRLMVLSVRSHLERHA